MLRRFASPPDFERIWTYDMDAGTARESTVDATAFEKHLYSVTTDSGERITEIERLIGQIEANAAPGFTKLIARGSLTEQERMYVASLIALTFVRTNAFRRMYAEMMGLSLQSTNYIIASDDRMFEAFARDFQRDRGPISEEEMQRLRQHMLDPSGYIMGYSREATLKAMAVHDRLTPLLNRMRWTLIFAPENRYFITSDNPVTRVVAKEHFHPIYGDGGFLNRDVQVTVPLTPQVCLLAHWNESLPPEVNASSEQAKSINRTRAFYSERFLFAPKFDAGIKSLAAKYKGTGLAAQVTGAGPETPAEVVMKRRL